MIDVKGQASVVETPAAFLKGEMVGRFRLDRPLGSGGMGEVYLAYDTRLRRQVAIKRLSARLHADPIARRRFLKEAERASQLNHSHIASIYELLEQDGEIYLVMEFVEGQSLRDRIQHPSTIEEFIAIASQCLEALEHAHSHGILHCDLKPENILFDSSGQVKILDFGLSRHLPRSDQSSTLGETHALTGTPGYMAPELLLHNTCDQRTDIFALGVVFYEILTGLNPFQSNSLAGTLDRILHGKPSKISVYQSAVPVEIEGMVSKMLAKAPEQRYQNVPELLVEFEPFRQSIKREQACHSPIAGKIGLRSFPRYRFLLGVLVCLLAGYTARQSQLTNVGNFSKSVIIADFDSFGEGPTFEGAVREALSTSLQQSPHLSLIARPRIYEALARMKKPNVTHIDENLGRELCLRENANVLMSGSVAHVGDAFQIIVRASEPHNGNLIFSQQVTIRNRNEFFPQIDALVLRVRKSLGESQSAQDNPGLPLAKVTTNSLEALQFYSQAIDEISRGKIEEASALLQRALSLDPNFAMAHLRLGQCYSWSVGKNEPAQRELFRAYDLRAEVPERERLWIESQYFNFQERYEDAAKPLEVLLQKYSEDADVLYELAAANFNLGKVDLATDQMLHSLKLNPNSSSGYSSLFFFLVQANRYDEALALYQSSPAHDLQDPHMSWGIGLAYLGKGDVTTARKEFANLRRGSSDDQDLAEIYLAVADLYEGKLQAALRKLEGNPSSAFAARSRRLPTRYNLIGRARILQGDLSRAQTAAERILNTGSTNLQTVDFLFAGTIFVFAGNNQRANEVLEKIKALCDSAPSGWNKSTYHALQGEISLGLGNADAALNAFNSALEAYSDPVFHAGLARAYQKAGDLKQATREWNLSLAAQGEILQNGFPPDLVLAHLALARAYKELNDLPQAQSQYKHVLELWRGADNFKDRLAAQTELAALTKTKID